MNNLLILTAPEGVFYERILNDFSEGFQEAGINSYWCTYNKNDKLIFYKKANEICPNLILEINSLIENRNMLSSYIKHAVWIQDYRFNGTSLIDGFGDSDFTYFIINPKVWDINLSKLKNCSVLYPGTRIDKHCNDELIHEEIDLSFVGFIPNPIDMNHLLFCSNTNRSIPLHDFLSDFDLRDMTQSFYSRSRIYKSINDACRKYNLISLKEEDLHLIDEVLPRTYERKFIVENLLNASNSVELYGPPQWLEWEIFKKYYKGYAQNSGELKRIYRKTRVNIHNGGLAMHYRVFECMGAGGFILINKTQLDNEDFGIFNYFKSGEHFVHYDSESLKNVITKFLDNEQERYRIRHNAFVEVQANHTWKHRAEQVIKDLLLSRNSFGSSCFSRRLNIKND